MRKIHNILWIYPNIDLMSTFRNLLTIWPLTSLHIPGSPLCLSAWHCLHVNCENWWREMALVAIIAAAWEPTTSHTQTALAKCLHIYNSAQVYSPWWRWPSWLRGSVLCVHYSKVHWCVSRHPSPGLPLRLVTRSTVSNTRSPPSSCTTRPGTRKIEN